MTDEDVLLDLRAVCAELGGSKPIHAATLYRGIKDGRYPKPVKIGPQTSRWIKREIMAVKTRAAEARP